MRTHWKVKASIVLILSNFAVAQNSFTQEIPPLVYDVEFTGVDCTMPPLPDFAELPIVEPLTDPFSWSDGSGRDTTFAGWAHRRAEIKAEIENYEIGIKPDRPDSITATYSNDTLIVKIFENEDSLTLVSRVSLPAGTGPFPAIIGMVLNPGFGSTGGLPEDIFTSRNIATIEFVHNQVTCDDPFGSCNASNSDPFFQLYPEYNTNNTGQYSAWAWGVSRLIDGLEIVQDSLPVDLEHLAVTGCSYAGKMALFAGALDERFALTIAQESGGGGAAAWRVLETVGDVETLGRTDHNWFREDMFQFSGTRVTRLPHDHHELMAMIAPRALFVIGNPAYVWLGDEAGYVSCEAAKLVWENFGIADRFGFSIVADANHCFPFPDIHIPRVGAFVDKFMLGDTLVNTDIAAHPYDYVIPAYWTEWWSNGDPYFPVFDRGESEEVWFEAECSTVGSAWNVRLDTAASNDSYAVVKSGWNNTTAPADSGAAIYFPFAVTSNKTFYVYGRVNTPTYDNDQFWIKINEEEYLSNRSYLTDGWEWKKLAEFSLSAGENTLSIAFCSEGFKLDKICISEFYYPPGAMGETADFTCVPDTTTKPYNVLALKDHGTQGTYSLGQNFPNPLDNNTTIEFELPQSTYTSLKVYSLLGEEIAELAGKEYPAGKHTVTFNAGDLTGGIYLYSLKADKFSEIRRMIIQPD